MMAVVRRRLEDGYNCCRFSWWYDDDDGSHDDIEGTVVVGTRYADTTNGGVLLVEISKRLEYELIRNVVMVVMGLVIVAFVEDA